MQNATPGRAATIQKWRRADEAPGGEEGEGGSTVYSARSPPPILRAIPFKGLRRKKERHLGGDPSWGPYRGWRGMLLEVNIDDVTNRQGETSCPLSPLTNGTHWRAGALGTKCGD